MRHPAFKTFPRQVLYIAACILTGLVLTLCQVGLVPVPGLVLLFDGLMFGVLAGLLSYLLWFVVLFADLSGGLALQRLVNHLALFVLLLAVFVGGGYLLELLLFPASSLGLSHALPLKLVFGLFLFQLVIRLYGDWRRDVEEEDAAESDDVVSSLASVAAPQHFLETISVKTGQKIQVIQVSDIQFFQAEGDYVLIHTPEGRFMKEQTMKYFEENLPADRFVRIHRSCIVHTDCISKIELYEKQNYRITLKSGQQLRASSAGYKLLKAALQL